VEQDKPRPDQPAESSTNENSWGAVLVEERISAGVIAVIMGVDEIFDRQRRDLLDGGLDLVVERRELAVHHDGAIGADSDGDVSALTLEHVGLVSQLRSLDLHLGEVDVLLSKQSFGGCAAGPPGHASPKKSSAGLLDLV
jgi:hypothetical protein